MSVMRTFEGWLYQHGDDTPPEPVSVGTLRKLLAAGYLTLTDTAWECFRNGRTLELSPPVTVEKAVKEDKV
jgi:hypothetical protein